MSITEQILYIDAIKYSSIVIITTFLSILVLVWLYISLSCLNKMDKKATNSLIRQDYFESKVVYTITAIGLITVLGAICLCSGISLLHIILTPELYIHNNYQ